ncbi:MAG: protoporphyrinogen oxidase [Candidatus Meridianibacter frigidus]|nr:MAG: protoporphyrinogen oxidase [Candidatus Eremiobacteraeota bacterium]
MRIVVLGAGISGLASAFYLREFSAEKQVPLELIMLEGSERTGGCIETRSENGFTMEMGADTMLTDKPWGVALIDRLGLREHVQAMRPEFKGAGVARDGKLVSIPDDFRLFTPTSMRALLSAGLFSVPGRVRMALESFIPPQLGDEDESLASFVTRRLGREVLDRLAQPLIGGIYSGDPHRLSMQATLPQFVEMERRYGSLARAMVAARKSTQAKAPNATLPRMAGLRGGFGTLIAALEHRLADAIRHSQHVTALSAEGRGGPNARWIIETSQEKLHADALISALPAYATAGLLRSTNARLAELLENIRYHSVATVTFAFETSAAQSLPPTYGFVVPAIEGRKITAATITSQKYAARAPANKLLLRAFVGGALQGQLLQKSDEDLTTMALSELRDLLGINGKPLFSIVKRHPRSMPEYALGHRPLVCEIEREASSISGLALAGSAYYGAGIPDCVHSAKRAAEKILAARLP